MGEGGGGGEQRFLPPEPSGPEPDLGEEPPAERPPVPSAPDPAPSGWQQPPAYRPPPGYGQPPPGYGQQQPGWQQPPADWQGPPQWEQPTAGQQGWAWHGRPTVPDNGNAVAGFILSLTAGGLLIISAGLSSVISIICAVLGIVYSKRGRARVDRGETPKHRGLAQAGYIIGIVSVVLAVLAAIGWILVFTDDDFWEELEEDSDGSDGTETSLGPAALRAGALAARLAVSLL